MQTSFFTAMLIATVLLLLYKYINYAPGGNFGKVSPFECGFEPSSTLRRPFSVRFFLLVVLFLIFDVESVLFFPVLLEVAVCPNNISVLMNMYLLLLLLGGGLMYEWKNGMLDWV